MVSRLAHWKWSSIESTLGVRHFPVREEVPSFMQQVANRKWEAIAEDSEAVDDLEQSMNALWAETQERWGSYWNGRSFINTVTAAGMAVMVLGSACSAVTLPDTKDFPSGNGTEVVDVVGEGEGEVTGNEVGEGEAVVGEGEGEIPVEGEGEIPQEGEGEGEGGEGGLDPDGDEDGDLVKNSADCAPFDETKQVKKSVVEDQDGDLFTANEPPKELCQPFEGTSPGFLANPSPVPDCEDRPDGADGIPGTADDGANIHPGADELCDTIDQNCVDGPTDGYDTLGDECSVGVGECAVPSTIVCDEDDPTQVVCDAEPGDAIVELSCDGQDNDCDGDIDEGDAEQLGVDCDVGVGACYSTGVTVCDADLLEIVCDAVPGEPSDELCGNDVDEDCDGVLDNGYDIGAECSVGVGECVTIGELVCNQAGDDLYCDAEPGEPQAERCDDRDWSCDGDNYDGFDAGDVCIVGVGECERVGEKECNDAGNNTYCNVEPGVPSDEVCNGGDDDCDGEVDNDLTDIPTEVCDEGVGVCYDEGIREQTCLGAEGYDGMFGECSAQAGEPGQEFCGDDLDSDCDGNLNNGYDIGADCEVGVGECITAGETVCNEAGDDVYCNAEPGQPVAERCDDRNWNCDVAELTYDGFPFGEDCSVGEGACEVEAVYECTPDGASVSCPAVPGDPAEYESCNLIDDDCDGATDEAEDLERVLNDNQQGVCEGSVKACDNGVLGNLYSEDHINRYQDTESLCDGVDNDCDGRVDISHEGVDLRNLCYADGDDDGQGVILLEGDVPGDNVKSRYFCGPCPADPVDGVKWVPDTGDCADRNEDVYSGALEVCDGQDNDCDEGTVDGADDVAPLLSEQRGVCFEVAQPCVAGEYVDAPNANIAPGYQADENLCDTFDNDCDGETDEGLLTENVRDRDGDGFGYDSGAEGDVISRCGLEEGYAAQGGDCVDDILGADGVQGTPDDGVNINPGAQDTSDLIDNNCNGVIDDEAFVHINATDADPIVYTQGCDPNVYDDCTPNNQARQVTLTSASAGYFQGNEVNNALYEKCVDAGACAAPRGNDHNQDDNTPVANVKKGDAEDFCAWAYTNSGGAGSLPTEAQWEYVARGDNATRQAEGNDRRWAHGDNPPDCTIVNFNPAAPCVGESTVVGSYNAESALGAKDMTGNVVEWVSDLFGPYAAQPVTDPTGPAEGDFVARGGHFFSDAEGVTAYSRLGVGDINASVAGFRCFQPEPADE